MGEITIGTVSCEIIIGNEPWAGVMEGGQGDQEVTGKVQMPTGEVVDSGAAVIGGTAFGTSEPATGIITESKTMIESLFEQLVGDAVGNGDLDGAAQRVMALETFLTNLLQTRLSVYLSECENENEVAGTMAVIEGSRVVLHVDFNIEGAMKQIATTFASAIGGGS